VIANAPRLGSAPARLRLTRIRSIPAEVGLGTIVLASFGLRFAVALQHTVPRLFPDEYIYEQLARGIAHGRLTIRGQPAHFPALLEPLLAAPFWLTGDVNSAFRLTQAMHSLVASLVAVPVYLLARRLALPTWQCLICAGCAALLPGLIFATYITADAVGLTFSVAAVYAGVRALDRPTRGSQLVFLALAALATLTRVQYVVVVGAFVFSALVVARGRPWVALKRYPFALGILGVGVAAVLVQGTSKALGYYGNVLNLHLSWGIARWSGNDAMLIVYGSGYVLVPLAIAGLVLAVTRPQTTAEHAFGVFTTGMLVLLFAEASLYAANGSGRFQERYLMALEPLVPILFCLCLRRELGRTSRIAVVGFAAGFLVLAARVPLSGYGVSSGSQDSPVLQALLQIERLTSKGTGSLIVALSIAVLSLPALLPLSRWRHGVTTALATGAAALFVISLAAIATDVHAARNWQSELPRDLEFVDHSGLHDVSVLVTPSTFRPATSTHLFWNLDLTRVLQMGGPSDVADSFGSDRVQVAADGTILARGRPVTRPLLVEEYADTVQLDDARVVDLVQGASLWEPRGAARLTMLAYGRYADGWLSGFRATFTVWPHQHAARRGVLCLGLYLPAPFRRTVRLRAPGYSKAVAVSPRTTHVAVPVVAAGKPWVLNVTSARVLSDSGRIVAARSERPRFVELPPGHAQAGSAACR
jgi:hypothetical protein